MPPARCHECSAVFRRQIPVDLLPDYDGKKEIMRSLRTTDWRDEQKRTRLLDVEYDPEFEQFRRPQSDAAPGSVVG